MSTPPEDLGGTSAPGDAPSEDYDPFAVFDGAMGSGAVRDPYPTLAELRENGPIFEGNLSEYFDVQLPSVMPESGKIFTALSFDTVSRVLLEGDVFSSSGYAASMGLVMGHSILEMDEPEHHRYRSVIQQAFNPRAMERWERDLVAPTVNACIDRFASRGRADLVRELAFPFPIQVISGMLGLPEKDLPQFHRWAVELISIVVDIQRGLAASQSLRDYFVEILAPRRTKPEGDLISVLAQAELDGTRLSDEDIFAFLRLLLPAGGETTYRSSSNLLYGLLTNPNQLDDLRRDRSLMRAAIEEGLRWEPPLIGIPRTAMKDVELAGVPIPKGSIVSACLGAANRDPERFENPDRFDIHRKQGQHMAFAYGVHTCLGMHLARMETRVAIDAILDRLPNVRLDPEAEDVHISGLGFRAPGTLPVVFDATS